MSETSKQVNTSRRGVDVYLFIIERLKQGSRPSKIAEQLGITKQALTRYLSTLKASGFIKKVGYGVWEILKEYDSKQVNTSTRVAYDKTGGMFTSFKQDNVRAHAFQFTLKLPRKLPNWENRAELMRKNGIEFKDLKIHGGAQRLDFRGRKVWLTNSSVIVYEKASYLAETAKDGKKHAVYDFLALVKSLETFLRADFSKQGKYLFKVTRQHYSLVKNALAQQYDREGQKLQVYNSTGLWFLIDNSFNLHEAETVHPKTADVDNAKVQNFFNGIKQYDGFTPQFVVTSLAENAQNLGHYAQHLQSHVGSIQELGTGVKAMTEKIGELTNIIKELKR